MHVQTSDFIYFPLSKDETKQEITESPDSVIAQESKQPQSKGDKKMTQTVKFLDEE